jgi:threonine dehydratase
VLGPDDDITLFEYVKRNNRETGPRAGRASS